MKFNDDILHTFSIADQDNTLPDITELIETYYDLGKVVDLKKLTIGETNFNYYITLKKEAVETKYFAQLFSADTSIQDLKHELALREYFMENHKTALKCALPYFTKDGGYTVICNNSEFARERYFCMFQFMEGTSLDYDSWAFGRMSRQMMKGIASGIADYHIGAYGFSPPDECVDIKMSYPVELERYRQIFTEEFEKRRRVPETNEYFVYFAEYQTRLLELLDRYTKRYLEAAAELPICMSHIDSSANNYLFDKDCRAVVICDLNWSQVRPRIFDLCWMICEGFCEYNAEKVTTYIDINKCVDFINAYDEAIIKARDPNLSKLTEKEREMLPEIFQLVAIRLGFYNIWVHILTDNPTDSPEYNIYWGNCSKTAMEFIEANMEEFKTKLLKKQ